MTHPRPGRIHRLATAGIAALVPLGFLAGCAGDDSGAGGDGGEGGDAGSSQSSPEQSETVELSETEQRVRDVIATQVDFDTLAPEAFGVIPEGLPEGVLPGDQDPNYVVGMGDETGRVLFVQSTQEADAALTGAVERLTETGYAEDEAVDVGEIDDLVVPDDADPAAFGELRTFSTETTLVAVGARAVDIGEDVPLKSVLMFVVSPT